MSNWRIPLSDLDYGPDEEEAVLHVLKSKWLSTGPVTSSFEKSYANYLGGGFAIAVSSGTSALHLALACMNLEQGDEVILPSLTFVATANAILYVRGLPIFADITSMDDLNISPEEIEKKISRRTKAILVMHYGGYPCDMDSILTIAKQHHLYVIEDAAHAPGAEYHKEKCGTLGDISCFSFFSNKNLVTGEGGMIFTKNAEFAERTQRMRSHGMKTLSWDKYRGHLSAYDIDDLGYNYRITEIQSALGLVQLKKLDRNNQRRGELVEIYWRELCNIEDVSIPFFKYGTGSSYHIFSVLISSSIPRDKIINELKDLGIQSSIHYPPVHLFSLYRRLYGYQEGMFPKTEEVSRREISLPLYPNMNNDDVCWICKKVREVIRKLK